MHHRALRLSLVLGAALSATVLPVTAPAQQAASPRTATDAATDTAAEAPADAPDAGALSVELNDVAPAEGACRLTFLARNDTDADLDELSLETVILTPEGRVERLTLFDLGALPSGRPRVRQFDLAQTDCGQVGRVLVNGVAGCSGGGMEPATCLDALRLSSRSDVGIEG